MIGWESISGSNHTVMLIFGRWGRTKTVLYFQFEQIQLCWFISVNNYIVTLDLELRKMSVAALILLILSFSEKNNVHEMFFVINI